ncbi:MAG: prepilin-type N-terminal cleavage/methylation domain-containing protein [Planctomycetota bacterium]|jgi:prepilin-type N-terminal cleavage/methylation domain-containing protein
MSAVVPSPVRRRGFTLVEMIVVIGVIVLLVGLTVSLIPAITGQSQRRETENILRLVDLAVDDWESTRDKRLSVGSGPIFDVNTDEYPDLEDQTERLLQLVMRRPESAEILRQIPGRFLVADEEDNGWDLLDAWGEAVVMIYPGLPWTQGSGLGRDDDGTVRTVVESGLGVAVNRKLAFVSAGPDTRLGDLHLNVALDGLSDDQTADADAAADNIYSYSVLKERPE